MNIDDLLERTQWDTFWVPPDLTVIDRPELLLLSYPRSAHGLNAVHRLRAPDADLPRLIDEIAAHHAGRSSRVQLYPSNIRPALTRALTDAGYVLAHRHDAYTLATDSDRPSLRPGLIVHPIDTLARLSDANTVKAAAFGLAESPPDAETQRRYLADCTGPSARVHRFVAYDAATSQPLSAGGMTTFPDLSFGFLWAGGTVPEGRGRGAYTALVTARVLRAQALGIARVGLYARLDSSAPIVAAQGFSRHGPMHHWIRE
ncbi:MAG: hypothetical protein ACI8RZ_007450 [Myxococcota bacterium]